MKSNPLVLAGLALLAPAVAFAGGFSVSEVDSKASGRGYAALTKTDSASTVFYNPANMTRMQGLNLNLGVAALMPKWTFTPAGDGESVDSDTVITTPPAVFATYKLGPIASDDALAFGVGFYVPFGSSFTWPDSWAGAGSAEKVSLRVFELSPAVAFSPAKSISLGFGFRYLPASVYWRRAIELPTTPAGEIEMAGSGHGIGSTVALSLWPRDGLSFAVVWRSAVDLELEGDSNLSLEPPFDTAAHDRELSADIPLAETLRFAIGFDLLDDKLNIGADMEIQKHEEFEDLTITFVNPDGTESEQAEPRNSENSFVFHLGADYRVMDNLEVRAGYIYDQKTLPESTLGPAPPESNRHVIAVGASYYLMDWLGVHAHFLNVLFSKRETLTAKLKGTYEGGYPAGTMAYTFGLSLTANFDVAPILGGKDATARAGALEPALATTDRPTTGWEG